jgi:hypothetical protein
MLYCDSRFSQTLTGLSPALPGALLCNATRRLGDGQLVILRQRLQGSVRAVRAVRNTRVFQTETWVVADASRMLNKYLLNPRGGEVLRAAKFANPRAGATKEALTNREGKQPNTMAEMEKMLR